MCLLPPHFCYLINPSSLLQMVSVERVIAYTKLKPEAPLETPPGREKPPGEWPQCGNIHVDQMKFRYAQDTPYILKGISIDIKPEEKVGLHAQGSNILSEARIVFSRSNTMSDQLILDVLYSIYVNNHAVLCSSILCQSTVSDHVTYFIMPCSVRAYMLHEAG